MSKINYLTFNDTALVENEGTFEFTQEFKTATLDSTKYFNVVKIGKDTEFVGQASGDTYTIDEIGKRNDTDGLFKGASPVDYNMMSNGSVITISSDLANISRINNLGLSGNSNYISQFYGANPFFDSSYRFVVGDVVEVEEGALTGLDFVIGGYNLTAACGANYILTNEELLNPSSIGLTEDYIIYKNLTSVAPAVYEVDTVYGLVTGFETGPLVSEGVLTLPDTDIYSFSGESNLPLVINTSVSGITKIVLPTSHSITAHIDGDTEAVISYDSVDYTATGTGNNDTFADLNAKLITDGVCAEGFEFVVIANA